MAWRRAYSLDTLGDEILGVWPGTTIWDIGDKDHRTRRSDHNPNDAGVVCAIDVLGHAQSDALFDRFLELQDPRIKYVIHDERMFSSYMSSKYVPAWTVRPYGGSNPHDNHIHVSVGRGPSGGSADPWRYDDDAPWGIIDPDKTDPIGEAMSLLGLEFNGEKSSRGRLLQQMILRIDPGALPKYGADSEPGGETLSAYSRLARKREDQLLKDGIGPLDLERFMQAYGAATGGGGDVDEVKDWVRRYFFTKNQSDKRFVNERSATVNDPK